MENARGLRPRPTRRPGACSCTCGGPATRRVWKQDPDTCRSRLQSSRCVSTSTVENRRGEDSHWSEVDIGQISCMPSLRKDSEPSGRGTQCRKPLLVQKTSSLYPVQKTSSSLLRQNNHKINNNVHLDYLDLSVESPVCVRVIYFVFPIKQDYCARGTCICT